MTAKEMKRFLEELLNCEADEGCTIHSVRTFEDLGIMTNNQGLVVRNDDGSEFQITITEGR